MNQEALMRMKLRARGYRYTFSYALAQENKQLIDQVNGMTSLVATMGKNRQDDIKLINDLAAQLRMYELKEKHETT